MLTTRKLITLLIPIALLSACATDSYLKPSSTVEISIGMRGNNYFCVYEKSWKIDGWTHSFYREGTKSTPSDPIKDKSCTVQAPFNGRPDQAHVAPYYTHHGSGVDVGKRNFKKLEVTFKRSVDGPVIKIEFNLENKLIPLPEATDISTIYPVITETGVDLVRVDKQRRADRTFTKFFRTTLDSKKDGE